MSLPSNFPPEQLEPVALCLEVSDQPPTTLVRQSIPWLTSLVINFSLLLILALLAIPMLAPGGTHEIVVALGTAGETEAVDSLDALPTTTGGVLSLSAASQAIGEADVILTPDAAPAPQAIGFAPAARETWSGLPSRQQLDMPTDVGGPPKPLSSRELTSAGTINDAVDGIGGQIRQSLTGGDLLVIWLLDASLSLVDDRQRVADRLRPIYEEITRQQEAAARASRRANPPILTSAVVAYGGIQAEVVSPTGLLGRAVEAIRKIPIDQTGLENVMAAVQRCVYTYPTTIKRRTMIVIWTDESGDDNLLLEPTIQLCRQADVKVSIVGPTAVLGAEEGSHVWTHESGKQFHLPVDKGPDTSLPERLRWSYWWSTSASNLEETWYGGNQLAGIASGFPPYALTRLALETGGTMTIFDREVDRGPFKPEELRDYTPDYRSMAELADEMRYFPFRLAILKSVNVTRGFTTFAELARLTGRAPLLQEDIDQDQLRGMLSISDGIAWRSPRGGEPGGFNFCHPGIMRRELAKDERRLQAGSVAIEQALVPLTSAEVSEHFYASERSPRWQAWYDLTYGRLLAQSVRYAEARALLLRLVNTDLLPDDINHLHFSASSELRNGEQVEQRAKEAERLLNRCIKNHPKSPWAYLAQRELEHPLGIEFRSYFRRPPKVSGGGAFRRPSVIVPPRL